MKATLRLEGVDAKKIEKNELLSSPLHEHLTGWSLVVKKKQHQSINFSKMYPYSCSYFCDAHHGLEPCDIRLFYSLQGLRGDQHIVCILKATGYSNRTECGVYRKKGGKSDNQLFSLSN